MIARITNNSWQIAKNKLDATITAKLVVGRVGHYGMLPYTLATQRHPCTRSSGPPALICNSHYEHCTLVESTDILLCIGAPH